MGTIFAGAIITMVSMLFLAMAVFPLLFSNDSETTEQPTLRIVPSQKRDEFEPQAA